MNVSKYGRPEGSMIATGRPGSTSRARSPAAILRAPADSSPYVMASGVSPSARY